MKSLKYIRIVLAVVVLFCITALILDTTEGAVLRHWLGWMPKVQLLPAILALNVVVVVAILLLKAKDKDLKVFVYSIELSFSVSFKIVFISFSV